MSGGRYRGFLIKLRISGDYLQTSAVIRDQKVISAINDPNTYQGPGSGYQISDARRKEIITVREELDRQGILNAEAAYRDEESGRITYSNIGKSEIGNDLREIVVAISPAFGKKLFRTLAGHPLSRVLSKIKDGISSQGSNMRVIRCLHSADTSFLGLSAAKLSGSGIGIGLQAKGTAGQTPQTEKKEDIFEMFYWGVEDRVEMDLLLNLEEKKAIESKSYQSILKKVRFLNKNQ